MPSPSQDNHAPDNRPTLDPVMFSFLWHHTAAMAAHFLGVAEIPRIDNDYRIDCVQRLGALYLVHRDVLDESASHIMGIIAEAAIDLRKASGH